MVLICLFWLGKTKGELFFINITILVYTKKKERDLTPIRNVLKSRVITIDRGDDKSSVFLLCTHVRFSLPVV